LPEAFLRHVARSVVWGPRGILWARGALDLAAPFRMASLQGAGGASGRSPGAAVRRKDVAGGRHTRPEAGQR